MTQTILLVSVYWLSSPFCQETFNKFQPVFDGYVCLQVPKGKLFMSLLTKRLVSIAASTVLLSFVSASANAQTQTEFHNISGTTQAYEKRLSSFYTFHQPMILNSIGFFTGGLAMTEMSYSLNDEIAIPVTPASAVDSNGFQWYEFSGGKSISAGTTLGIHTNASVNQSRFWQTGATYNYSSAVISYGGVQPEGTSLFVNIWTNSNIRVSNPGSNVAPEPGSFALALTGGAALVGICIRRRRNAA
jgi:hypothetical protein